MIHPRCEDCPIAGTCIVEVGGHTPYCDWARQGGDRLERVRELSASYPSLAVQAGNAARALGRVISAAVQGEPVFVPDEERDRRLAICRGCAFYDLVQARCTKCGCGGMKPGLATEHCPLDPPKW
jgi:hypothetical protein